MIVNKKFHSISTLPNSQLTICQQTNFSFHDKESFSPFKSFVVYLLCFLPFLCVSLAAPFHAATNKSTVFPTTANSNVDTEYNHVTKADQVADALNPSRRPALVEKKTILDARVETKNGVNKVSFIRDTSPDDNHNDDNSSNNNDNNNNNNNNDNSNNNNNEEVARILSGLLEATPSMDENRIGHETRDRRKRAVTQALCPIKQGKHGEDEIAQLTRSTCTQTIAQSMCEEDERMEVRRGEIRPLGAERSAAVYYGHDLCFSFFSRGATKTDGCMSMCMQKDREYEVSLDVSGYTRTYWTLKFTGDCYFCGFSQPLTVIACVFLSIVVIATTCCICCRTDPSRQLSTMHQAMQQQMQKIVNSRNPPAEEAKNPPEEEEQFQTDAGAENQGDVTIDDDNLNVTRDDDNLNVTRDDDNLNATRDTRSRGSPSGTRASPSMQSRSEFAEAVTPSAPVADDSRLFDESKDWTDREC